MTHSTNISNNQYIVAEISRSIASNPYLADLGAEAVARLLDDLPQGTRVDLYGCGNLGAIMATQHATSLKRLDVSFLTTDGGSGEFHGFPRRDIEDARLHPAAHAVLLSYAYQASMLHNLKGIMPDHAVHPLIRIISTHTNWSDAALQTLLDMQQERLAPFIAAIKELALRKSKVVCIAVPLLLPHMPKIMSELHEHGLGVVLFVENDSLGQGTVYDLEGQGYFDLAFTAQSSYTLELYLLSHLTPLHVIHSVIGSWINTALAFLVEHAGCPVVAEYCDLIPIVFDSDASAIKNFCRTPEGHELECDVLRTIHLKAAGIVHKDSQEGLDAISSLYNGQTPQRSLHYMPYCGKRFISPWGVEKYSATTRRIHVVHAGGMVNNPLWHNYKPFHSQLWAARQLDAQNIAFHLFNASDSTGKGFEDYLALQEELRYFRYNTALPYAEMRNVLPAYDYAWFVFDYSEAVETELYRVSGMGSKIFSYLEAGLPILSIPRLTFQHEFIMDNGIGVALHYEDIPRLGEILRSVDYEKLQENICKAQTLYSHEQHLPRLLHFYEQCQEARDHSLNQSASGDYHA